MRGRWRGVNAHYGGFHGDLKLPEGYMAKTGIHNVISCFYLIAMQRMYVFSELLGDRGEAERLLGRIDTLSRSIDLFWDEERHCYADNLSFDSHSSHANLLPVLAGVVPRGKLPAVRRYVAGDLRSVFKSNVLYDNRKSSAGRHLLQGGKAVSIFAAIGR